MAEMSVLVEQFHRNVRQLRGWMASEEGASVVEYGLIVSLLAAAVVTLVGTLGGKILTALSAAS
jgi:Flp pilus assembly pilin Flp